MASRQLMLSPDELIQRWDINETELRAIERKCQLIKHHVCRQVFYLADAINRIERNEPWVLTTARQRVQRARINQRIRESQGRLDI